MADYPKPIKKLLREYLAEAYEAELQRELTKLDRSFAEWRAGKISSGELSYRVHQYETSPSRELYKRYNGDLPDMMVAYAIVAGILPEAEVPAELLEAIDRPLSFYRSLKERNELNIPE
jgi:hypothetical protein